MKIKVFTCSMHPEVKSDIAGTCPKCGMELKLGEEVSQEEYSGKTYYFCSENCKEHFAANPQKYT